MKTKKVFVLLIAFCLLLTGCADPQTDGGGNDVLVDNKLAVVAEIQDTADMVQAENSQKISPLHDTTMENLTDAILSVSLDEGNAYVDDSGIMQMNLKIYTYDPYFRK